MIQIATLNSLPTSAADPCGETTGNQQADQGDRGGHDGDPAGRRQHRRRDGQRRADGEGGGRRQRRLQGACAQFLGDAELIARMRGERVMGGELFGDLAGEGGFESALHVDLGELGEFETRLGMQLAFLDRQIGGFGVRL